MVVNRITTWRVSLGAILAALLVATGMTAGAVPLVAETSPTVDQADWHQVYLDESSGGKLFVTDLVNPPVSGTFLFSIPERGHEAQGWFVSSPDETFSIVFRDDACTGLVNAYSEVIDENYEVVSSFSGQLDCGDAPPSEPPTLKNETVEADLSVDSVDFLSLIHI